MMNGKGQDVYRLPPPTACAVNPSGEPVNLRIPQSEKPTVTKVLNDLSVFLLKLSYHTMHLYENFTCQMLNNLRRKK